MFGRTVHTGTLTLLVFEGITSCLLNHSFKLSPTNFCFRNYFEWNCCFNTRDVPFSSVYLLFYSKFKSLYSAESRIAPASAAGSQLGHLPDLVNFLCGLCAGLLGRIHSSCLPRMLCLYRKIHSSFRAVLQTRDIYPGSQIRNFSILDPGSELFPFRIPDLHQRI